MIGPFCVEAHLSLLATTAGGLKAPMPTGSRSLLLIFPAPGSREGTVQIGAVIDLVDAQELPPGGDRALVRLRFWADEAPKIATPDTPFELWHGRIVGNGVVKRVVGDG